jgi:hypothetical protein
VWWCGVVVVVVWCGPTNYLVTPTQVGLSWAVTIFNKE